MSSQLRTLYTGVTNDVLRRVFEHKEKVGSGFAARYNVTKLVYLEEFSSIRDAIAREKQIKAMRRSKKVDLIRSVNPRWADLAEDSEGQKVILKSHNVIPNRLRRHSEELHKPGGFTDSGNEHVRRHSEELHKPCGFTDSGG